MLAVDALAVLAALLLVASAIEGERDGDPWASLGYVLGAGIAAPALVSLLLLAVRRRLAGGGADALLALAAVVGVLPTLGFASLLVVG